MSEPIENKHPRDVPSEGNKEDDGQDAVKRFHEQNRKRKSELLNRLAQGAAFQVGKEAADQFNLYERVVKFIGWLTSF